MPNFMPNSEGFYLINSCSILGLGDILIPGIFIIFMARFGFEVVNSQVYFRAAIIAYVLAILACESCLFFFHADFPALLYIAPALIITVTLVGWWRGELKMLKVGIPKCPRNY